MNNKLKRGFTLIELLVVIFIIGVLAALVLVNFNAARERARDTQRKSDLKMIKTSLTLYYNSCEAYPEDSEGLIKGCSEAATCITANSCSWGSSWQLGENIYMRLLPQDPMDSQSYHYTRTDKNNFILVSYLENLSDEAGATSRTQCGYTNEAGKNEYLVCDD